MFYNLQTQTSKPIHSWPILLYWLSYLNKVYSLPSACQAMGDTARTVPVSPHVELGREFVKLRTEWLAPAQQCDATGHLLLQPFQTKTKARKQQCLWAPAHCSVLDSGVFSPLECGFIFFLLNLTMCLNIFSSLCVCFYSGRGPPLSVQPAVLQFLKCKRPRTETWDPMTWKEQK